jgi:hypothetical protein
MRSCSLESNKLPANHAAGNLGAKVTIWLRVIHLSAKGAIEISHFLGAENGRKRAKMQKFRVPKAKGRR